MASGRQQYLEQRLPIPTFSWDATGLIVNIVGHKLLNGFTVTAVNTSSSYDSVTGIVEVIGADSFRIVAAPVLGSFSEVIVRGFMATGLTPAYSIRKGAGAETVVQSWVTGTNGATFTPQFSMNGTNWVPGTAVTHTTGATSNFTLTPGWAYIRLNITAIGASTILSVVLGD